MDVFKEIYKDAYDIDLNEEQFLIFNFIDENISESDFILEIMDLNENLINTAYSIIAYEKWSNNKVNIFSLYSRFLKEKPVSDDDFYKIYDELGL